MRIPSPSLILILPLSILGACAGGGADKGGDDSGANNDGADGTEVVYDEGCILVDGAGGYAWINGLYRKWIERHATT